MNFDQPSDRVEKVSTKIDFGNLYPIAGAKPDAISSTQEKKLQANKKLENEGILPKFEGFENEIPKTEIHKPELLALRSDGDNSLNPSLAAKSLVNDIQFMSLKQNRNSRDLEEYVEERLNDMAKESRPAARQTAAFLDCRKVLDCDSLGFNDPRRQIRLRLNYDNHEQAWSAKIVEKPNLPFKVEPLSTKFGPSRPRTAIQF